MPSACAELTGSRSIVASARGGTVASSCSEGRAMPETGWVGGSAGATVGASETGLDSPRAIVSSDRRSSRSRASSSARSAGRPW